MVRRGNLSVWVTLVLVLFWSEKARAFPASIFDFNDGTVQGWTLDGAFDPEIYNVTFTSNFTDGWNDYYNYPEVPGLDPPGNMRGSLQMHTPSGHGIDNPGGEWWLMQFHSPDLSASKNWQRASGYSVRIAECMSGGFTTLYANLFVNVYDLDLGRERFFTNGVAAPLSHNTWSYHSHNWWDSTNFPTNYVIREVFVDIWGLIADGSYLSGGIYLDDVIPVMPIYVDDDGGGPNEDGSWEHPYDSIQKGINTALNGETVIVRDGTYTGAGNRDVDFLGKIITVRSENGPNSCIIDCEGTAVQNHRGFNFHSGENANSMLEGFSIINGFAQDGGGISCDINSSPSIKNCVIRDCNAHLGAGVYCKDSSPTITNCMISNSDANSGGGIYSYSSNPTITNCTFNGNQASNYGGAICCYSSNLVITNCTMQGNSAIDPTDSYGGGIYCNNSSATVKNCIFWANTASLSGSEIALVDTLSPSELTISYSDVDGGLAAAYVETGCTLNWDVSNINLDPCLMPDNYHLQSCSPCVDSGDFIGDYTDQIDIDGYSRIFNARVDIGADEFSPPIHNVTQDSYHDTIQQAINGAVNGDTISIPDGIYTGPGNRDVHFNGKAIKVRSDNGPANCVIDCDGAEGEDDHRGFFFNHNEESNSVLDGITITNGYCMAGGGIWCHYSNPTIINCIIRGNTANDDGGGILCSYSSATISNCTFIGNTAWRGGGAIACTESSQVTLNNCTTSYNISRWGGGIYCNNSSNPSIHNCIFWQDISIVDGAEIALKSRYYPSTLTVSYSNVAGGPEAAYVESGCTLNWTKGNINMDPLLSPDGHILADSPCINAGDPNIVIDMNTQTDIDDDDRIINGRVDMGSDEFIDTDGDRLPDWWENKYFGAPTIADHNADQDNDGLSNLHEYELYSSDPSKLPYYVNTTVGNDNFDGLAPIPKGDNVGPKKTIQAGINVTENGDTVIVAAGTYTGPGNRWLDFGSRLIVLRSSDGPSLTTIDCENDYTRAFNFHLGETPAAAVVGFTITNGRRNYGGAIVCLYSHPQIRNCLITDNSAYVLGSGLYSYMSIPTFADCNVTDNSPDGVWMLYGGAHIDGTVRIASNNWVGNNVRLTGDGTLQIAPYSTLNLDNSTIRCNLSGTGTVQVKYDSKLIIEGDAIIDLGHETDPNENGLIQCDGLLLVRDSVHLINTKVNVTRVSFEGDVDISTSVITAEAGAPYGQFFIEDSVHIIGNDIHADGDRYMDLDSAVFTGVIANNRIYVTITEGVGNTRGGLLELRGLDGLVSSSSCDPNNEFFCEVNDVPAFDTNSWMIEQLELVEGAKVNLTNRFDFDNGGPYEVMYVKNLVLGTDSILNTAFNQLYYKSLVGDPNSIRNEPLLSFSLSNIAFDNAIEFTTRVMHNNFMDLDPSPTDYSRIHVERVVGLAPDPNGLMRMCNMKEIDPMSPYYNQVINARAKGLFAKASEDEILILFEYLFGSSDPNVELVIYLTDVPELLDHNDPCRLDHYIEVARLYPPPAGQYGSVGSDHFGIFEKVVSASNLNFIRGLRMELELLGPDGTCILINNWDPYVSCIYCGDVTGDYGVTARDYLTVLGEFGGLSSGINQSGRSLDCLEKFGFSEDGFLDVTDLLIWDWGEWLVSGGLVGDLCFDIFLTPPDFNESSGSEVLLHDIASIATTRANALTGFTGSLLIGGKICDANHEDFLSDRLYDLDENYNLVGGPYVLPNDRMNGKLVRDHNDLLYQVNVEEGLVRFSGLNSVIPRDHGYPIDNEPRYEKPATVYIGFQGQGGNTWGRPVLDVDFDAAGYVYVTPTVIAPEINEPYTASVKLKLVPNQSPPYNVTKIYDIPPLPNSSQEDSHNLCEIEVDSSGNVYVINRRYKNNSDILWVYKNDGDVNKCELQNIGIYGPVGLCISSYDNSLLYVASSMVEPAAKSASLYVLSTDDLTLVQTITINNMGHITDIAEDPVTGTVWVVGFTMPEYMTELPSILVNTPQFYYPYLAAVPYGASGTVQATKLLNAADLALPLSIAWVGPIPEKCEGADLDSNGNVSFTDLKILASQWLQAPGNPSADIAPYPGGDGVVNLKDLAILAYHWLENVCK